MSLIDTVLGADGLFSRHAVRNMTVANTLEKERLRTACRHIDSQRRSSSAEYAHSRTLLRRRVAALDRAANGEKDVIIVRKEPTQPQQPHAAAAGGDATAAATRASTAEIVLKRNTQGAWRIIKSVRNSNDFVNYASERGNDRLRKSRSENVGTNLKDAQSIDIRDRTAQGDSEQQIVGVAFQEVQEGSPSGPRVGETRPPVKMALDANAFNELSLRLHRSNASVSNPHNMTRGERKIYAFLKNAVTTPRDECASEDSERMRGVNASGSGGGVVNGGVLTWRSQQQPPPQAGCVRVKQHNLVLPPVLLPPLHLVKAKPLPQPVVARPAWQGQEDWEKLRFCRYLRSGLAKFRDTGDQNDIYDCDDD